MMVCSAAGNSSTGGMICSNCFFSICCVRESGGPACKSSIVR